MQKLKKIILILTIVLIFFLGLFFFFFGIKIPFVFHFNKNNPDYSLEKIDLNNHENQSKDLIYSINVQELKKLVEKSDSTFQLVYFYNLTCPTVVKCNSKLKDSLFILENTEVFPICVSDRTLLRLLKEQLKTPKVKRYVIDSEKYYANLLDMYEHNNNAKINFLNELQPNTFFEGTYAILFKKWGNIKFIHDENYYKRYWKEGMNNSEANKLFVENLVQDIKKITK